MKKIAFIVPRYHPIIGGTELLAKNIIEYIGETNSNINIITQPCDDLTERKKYKYKIIETHFFDEFNFNKIIEYENYDLCVFFCDLHTPYLNFYNLKCKKNICILNLDETTYLNKDSWNLHRAESNLKEFDLVISFTKNGIANKFLEENNINWKYIPNFSRDILETEKKIDFKTKLFNDNKKLILYNAAIETRKNQFNLLQKINQSDFLKNYNWIFIGTTPDIKYLDNCIEFVKNNNLDSSIKFLKSTTNQQLIDQLYQSVDIVMLLSVAEGLPLVLLESISAKVPWIATPVGGIKGVLKDTNSGIILNNIDYSIDELETAIKNISDIDLNASREVWYKHFRKQIVFEKYFHTLKEYI